MSHQGRRWLPSGRAGWRPVLIKLALLAVFVAVLAGVWSMLPVKELVELAQARVQALGFLGFGLFALTYVLLTLVIGPASLLSASAGLVWGPVTGLAAVLVSATLASVIAMLVGRYLAYQRVQTFVARDPRMRAVVQAVADGSWRIVILLRLSPLLPFGVQNYLLSVTNIRVPTYAWATAVGILPSSALFVYLGSLGGGSEGGVLRWVLLGVGLVATALVVTVVTRRAQTALQQATGEFTEEENLPS